ncbi:hypothetical protein BDV96DRAFT_303979 [Lophiotrema nucula]|uniref:Uncharacterized protein n=1 Tax=Lophiotrema nucula TaxID=690887 RepID=A0A6A5YKR3_9PLEO|nr:hypothetical protein BDV96DRAFT_303979 [Lophiotrema nucula]
MLVKIHRPSPSSTFTNCSTLFKNLFLRPDSKMYRLSDRIRCELLVLASAILTLALTVPYAVQMWNAPLNTYTLNSKGIVVDNNKSARHKLIAMYGLPPLFSIVLTVVNICMTLAWGRIFVSYTIGMTATMAVGWLVTAVFWGHCAIDDESQSWEGDQSYS